MAQPGPKQNLSGRKELLQSLHWRSERTISTSAERNAARFRSASSRVDRALRSASSVGGLHRPHPNCFGYGCGRLVLVMAAGAGFLEQLPMVVNGAARELSRWLFPARPDARTGQPRLGKNARLQRRLVHRQATRRAQDPQRPVPAAGQNCRSGWAATNGRDFSPGLGLNPWAERDSARFHPLSARGKLFRPGRASGSLRSYPWGRSQRSVRRPCLP